MGVSLNVTLGLLLSSSKSVTGAISYFTECLEDFGKILSVIEILVDLIGLATELAGHCICIGFFLKMETLAGLEWMATFRRGNFVPIRDCFILILNE